ncbi:MAG: CopD family protein [Rubrivivax sp.]|nr:CopD family protein [Rubrivivax sp.]
MSLYALLKTLHVLAVVLWVGGMVFAHFFLRPSLAVLPPPQRLVLMHAVLGRFFAAVAVAVAVVVASGLWMVGRVARQAVAGGGSFSWPLDWSVMTVLGLVMAAVFVFIRLVPYRRFARAVQAEAWPEAGAALADVRRWVMVNLVLGVVVIVVATLV